MDQNQFTTTFIPKKPVTQATVANAPVSRPAGLFTTLVTLAFFLTILIAGGVYIWELSEKQKVAFLAESITKIEKEFETESVVKLQTLDKQLRNGSTLVKNHTVLSPVFSILESSTLPQVRFTKFDALFEDGKPLQIKMSGEADGYRSIAQQSDVFATNTFMKDAIFSNFALTQKGKISFDLSFGVKPELVDFEKAPLAIAPEPVTVPTQ